MLHHLAQAVWKENQLPSDWRDCIILNMIERRPQGAKKKKLWRSQGRCSAALYWGGFRKQLTRDWGKTTLATGKVDLVEIKLPPQDYHQAILRMELPCLCQFQGFWKDHETLWKLMPHYKHKLISITKSTNKGDAIMKDAYQRPSRSRPACNRYACSHPSSSSSA